jgi:hypothetical protein
MSDFETFLNKCIHVESYNSNFNKEIYVIKVKHYGDFIAELDFSYSRYSCVRLNGYAIVSVK